MGLLLGTADDFETFRRHGWFRERAHSIVRHGGWARKGKGDNTNLDSEQK